MYNQWCPFLSTTYSQIVSGRCGWRIMGFQRRTISSNWHPLQNTKTNDANYVLSNYKVTETNDVHRMSKSLKYLPIKAGISFFCLLCHGEPVRASTEVRSEIIKQRVSIISITHSWQHVRANYTSRNRSRLATGQEGHT